MDVIQRTIGNGHAGKFNRIPRFPLLAIGGRTSRMRETIIIVKEINPLMDPYIHHSCETDMSIKRNIDQLMLIGVSYRNVICHR